MIAVWTRRLGQNLSILGSTIRHVCGVCVCGSSFDRETLETTSQFSCEAFYGCGCKAAFFALLSLEEAAVARLFCFFLLILSRKLTGACRLKLLVGVVIIIIICRR